MDSDSDGKYLDLYSDLRVVVLDTDLAGSVTGNSGNDEQPTEPSDILYSASSFK